MHQHWAQRSRIASMDGWNPRDANTIELIYDGQIQPYGRGHVLMVKDELILMEIPEEEFNKRRARLSITINQDRKNNEEK